MQTVGYIDIKKYLCVAENITTSEVVITDERIQHIESHHPGHFERIAPFFQDALSAPDYILADKNPSSCLVLKKIEKGELRIQIILRLHTTADDISFKNSIISAWEVREKEYKRLARNKNILYKQE
ncbi:MAG: hypothetical protein HFF14_06505 [Angelakisella sp.]|nr:hypothetical protein [Angelakisella sp.]